MRGEWIDEKEIGGDVTIRGGEERRVRFRRRGWMQCLLLLLFFFFKQKRAYEITV